MLGKAFVFGVLGFGLFHFLEYKDWLQWNNRIIFKVRPGRCRRVETDGENSEDLVHIGDGIVLMTSGFNHEGHVGKMKILDLHSASLEAVPAKIINAPRRSDFMTSPHGMTYWREPSTGQVFVYVVTHPAKEDRIEVFEFEAPDTLHYLKSITDPSFRYMNDLVAVGKDQFYINLFWMSREKFYVLAETFLRLKYGKIFFYNGHRAREVASGFIQPNGINISPDKQTVYMASWGDRILYAYRRDPSNNLTPIWEKYMETGIDNIDVDPDTGDLWIGCHPQAFAILDFYDIFKFASPSQALRVKVRKGAVVDVEEIYADDGHEMAKSTVAIYVNKTLVIGSVSEDSMACDVNYLSP